MPRRSDDLISRLGQLEDEIERELQKTRSGWRYRIVSGRVRFAREVRLAHRRVRQSLPRFLRDSQLTNLLTAPVIYSMIVPVALLDFWISVYQRVCFPVYGIPRVRRSTYIVVDRHHLGYLNGIEKLNCIYCGYVNGVFAYVREVAGRTEQYWCPIRHASRVRSPHLQYRNFVEFGDAKGYHQQLPALREDLTRKE
jgi:hypothetical protein